MDAVREGRLPWLAAIAAGVFVAALQSGGPQIPRGVARVLAAAAAIVFVVVCFLVFTPRPTPASLARLGPPVMMFAGLGLLCAGAAWRSGQSPTGAGQPHVPQITCFDYSQNGGIVEVVTEDGSIRLKFTVGDRTSIHIHRDQGGIAAIAQLGGLAPGQPVSFASFPNTQSSDLIGLHESFALQTVDRHFLVGRTRSIKVKSRGDDKDEVCFSSAVAPDATGRLRAL